MGGLAVAAVASVVLVATWQQGSPAPTANRRLQSLVMLSDDPYEWQEPDITKQSRSPCPMLNTLANHGMLPRDGKGISADVFADNLKEHLNLNRDFWWKVADATIKIAKPGQDKVDLHDIALHNGIQHDAALTRNDMGQGQYFTRVNRSLVDQLIGLAEDGYLTRDSMGKARILRQQQCAAWNPNYSLPGDDPKITSDLFTNKKILAVDQAAIPLLVLSDQIVPGFPTYKVPVDRIREFFYYERLPTKFGWKRSSAEIAGAAQVFWGINELLGSYYKYKDQKIESPTGLHAPPPPNPHPDY